MPNNFYVDTKKISDSYDRVKNIKILREQVLHKIPCRATKIKLQGYSMGEKVASFRSKIREKFGTDKLSKMSTDQKKKYYEIVSEDPDFCRYYSILTAEIITY